MRITIDTNLKTLTVDHSINMKELINTLQKLLPDFAWEEYTLMPKTEGSEGLYPYIQPRVYPWTTIGPLPITVGDEPEWIVRPGEYTFQVDPDFLNIKLCSADTTVKPPGE